jgi:histidinol dehydrogenase
VGPGNIYVAAAKKLVSGDVNIDMVAGPSEVVVVADNSAEPSWIARDLLAQAEHDPDASAMLISNSLKLMDEVKRYLIQFGKASERAHIIKESLQKNCVFFLTSEIATAIELANLIAPEHLELEVEEPLSYLHLIKSVGALFLGKYTAESFGDYILGPNHTLPTQSTARFASPLSAATFTKFFNVAMVSQQAIIELFPYLEKIAAAEGLNEHARAASERYRALKVKK